VAGVIAIAAGLIVVVVAVTVTYSLGRHHRTLDAIFVAMAIVLIYVAIAVNVMNTNIRVADRIRIRGLTAEKILEDLERLADDMDRYDDYARIYARRLIGAVAISAADAAIITQVLHRDSPTVTLASVYLALIAFAISGIASLTTPGRIRETPPPSASFRDTDPSTPSADLRDRRVEARQRAHRAWSGAVVLGLISVLVFLLLMSSLALMALGQHLTALPG
jgi:hypothetical protein